MDKSNYYGYEKLVRLGGFIGEIAEKSLYSLVPTDVRQVIEMTGGIDNYFWQIIPELIELNEDCNTDDANLISDNADENRQQESRSYYWFYMRGTAIVKRRNLKSNKRDFYTWDISRRLKDFLDRLNSLEKEVLELYIGFDLKEKLDVNEIADKIGFPVEVRHIRMLLYGLEKSFSEHKKELEELEECIRQNCEEKNEKGFKLFG